MVKWATIALSVLGLVIGLIVVTTTTTAPPVMDPIASPSVNPFPDGIAASGLVEASTRNIELSTPQHGTVAQIHVQVNDKVSKDQPLFTLDTRTLTAERDRVASAAQGALAHVNRLKASPRAEDLAPLVAAVDRAQALFDDAKHEYEQAKKVYAGRAAGSAEVTHRKNAMLAAKGSLDQAQAEHDRVAAGVWKHDLAVAEAALAEAQAAVKAIDAQLDQLVVRSPIDGTVLRREIEPGQFVTVTARKPAMVVGNLAALHVRAQVDEEDAARLVDGAPAIAMVRGLRREQVSLKQIRIEPMAVPKQQLGNSTIELVDTRVVQVIYTVDGESPIRLFPGQLVDVFISTQQE